MAEKPILFSDEMVRAILAGRKTQTRRPVKPQPEDVNGATWLCRDGLLYPCRDELCRGMLDQIGPGVRPAYAPGDLLYVRETWAQPENVIYYRADEAALLPPGAKWRPSVRMPKWAARLWLRVTGVRVERVQDITDEGAIAEGIRRHAMGWSDGSTGYDVMTARDAFGELWSSTYGAKSWDRNDWVWVYEFERVGAPR